MKYIIPFLLLSFSIALFSQSKDKENLIYIGDIDGVEKKDFYGEGLGETTSMFFDKWNNVYLPVNYKNVIFLFNPSFIKKGTFDPQIDIYSGPGINYFNTINISDSAFLLENGSIKQVIRGDLFSCYFVVNDIFLKYPENNNYKAFLVDDFQALTYTVLENDALLDYIEEYGERYHLSVQDGAILYKGITWDPYGSDVVWGKDANFDSWLSIDKDANGYKATSVINPKGEVIKIICPPEYLDGKQTVTGRIRDFEGNIYYLNFQRIYYLGRDWGYDVIAPGKNKNQKNDVFLHAGLSELKIGSINPTESISIQEKTLQKEKIGSISAPWYKVKTASGLIGWVHGSSISISKDEDKLLIYDSPALTLRGLK